MTSEAEPAPAELSRVIYLHRYGRGGARTAALPAELAIILRHAPENALSPLQVKTADCGAWIIQPADRLPENRQPAPRTPPARLRVLPAQENVPQCPAEDGFAAGQAKLSILPGELAGTVEELARRGAYFRLALDSVAGASEWRIRLYADIAICRALAEWAPAVLPLRAELAGTPSGDALLLRRKLRDSIEHEVRSRLAMHMENLHAALSAEARETLLAIPWQPLDERRDVRGLALVSESAYLVEPSSHAHFQRLVPDYGELLAAEGVHIELTGPWPPYRFASLGTAGHG